MFHPKHGKAWRCCCAFLLFAALLVPAAIHAHSVSGGGTHLYSDSSGTSFLWNAGGAFSFAGNDSALAVGATYTAASSTLERISLEAGFVNLFAETGTKRLNLKLRVLDFEFQNISLYLNQKYTVDSASGSGVYLSLPLSFPAFSIAPSIALGSASTTKGNLHYLYADPLFPSAFLAGVTVSRKNLSISGYYATLAAQLYSERSLASKTLADATASAFVFFGQYQCSPANFLLAAKLGNAFISADAHGKLTASSQPYLLFPYKNFSFEGDTQIDVLLLELETVYSQKRLLLGINAQTAFCLYQQGSYLVEYLYKKNIFFDGSAGQASQTFKPLQNNGFSLVTLHADWVISAHSCKVELTAKKTFFIPLFFGENAPVPSPPTPPEQPTSQITVIDYLLSGISLAARCTF